MFLFIVGGSQEINGGSIFEDKREEPQSHIGRNLATVTTGSRLGRLRLGTKWEVGYGA